MSRFLRFTVYNIRRDR